MIKNSRTITIFTLLIVLCLVLSIFAVGCSYVPVDNDEGGDNPPVSDTTPDDPSVDPNNPSTNNPTSPKHKHNLIYNAGESATCTSAGVIVYWHCSECGENYADNEATQKLSDLTIPATGHKYEITENIDPTCTDDGIIKKVCSACGDDTSETVSATGHDYTETVINPTCTNKGYTLHKCLICDDEYMDTEVSATGHAYTETIVSPTCMNKGFTIHKCSDCDDEYTDNETSALGHDYSEAVIDPTCTEGGYTIQHCSRCDDEFTIDETSALGHDWEETVKDATCTESGTLNKVCNTCGETEESEISALGHSYIEHVVEPTCTEKGYTEHQCSRCENKYQDNERPATGHTYNSEWNYDDDEHWHDVLCGCDVDIEKVAHNYENGICECGKEEAWEYKLKFELVGDEYTVTGIEVAQGVANSSLAVIIPNEYNGKLVTKIAEGAFKDVKAMKSVYIPSSVKYIGKGAFNGCSIKEAEFENTKNWKAGGNILISLNSPSNNADALTKTYKNDYWIQK